ncbi:MAG: hypothetical protein JW982_02960 [Spirochaetes bacterium]|nr:hypothetical protein [Spirochaetota bacterium]
MLSDREKKTVLDGLNEICPDTFNEGSHGEWEFTDIVQDGKKWIVHFNNDSGTDYVSFNYDGSCVSKNDMSQDWFESLSAAVSDWEMEQMDNY